MSSLSAQLARAYKEQTALYDEIKELVNTQIALMEEQGDPQGVIAICGEVEKRMDEIAVIEDAMEPVRRKWEITREDPSGELEAVLAFVQAAIEEIVRGQALVQQKLLDFARSQREMTDGAQKSIKLNRACTLYKAG